MKKSQVTLDSDNPNLWQVMAAHRAPSAPPYPSDMQVTPLSTFGETTWVYPLNWASLNNRQRLTRDHLAITRFNDRTTGSLLLETDAVLIRQLKEACWAATHRRDLLGKASIPKPLAEHEIHRLFRRLLVGFKRLGCSSLAAVQQAELDEVLHVLPSTPAAFEELAWSFHSLIQFSKHGLIQGGLRDHEFEVAASAEITDTSGVRGIQPLTEEQASSIIRSSLVYIELGPKIASKIQMLREAPQRKASVLRWARRRLPCGTHLQTANLLQTLVAIVQVACANLIAFHLGLRVSELLSILRGFISCDNDYTQLDIRRMTIEFTRYKTIRRHFGKTTQMEVHPDLLRVAEVLEMVHEAAAAKGEHLLVPSGDCLPYKTNAWNYYLQKFCDLHSIDVSISSHRWRETVAALATQLLTGSALYLKELFGHAGLAMVARYMFASPLILDELRDKYLDIYRRRGKTLLDSLIIFGGPGLGGRQGKEWEEQFGKLSLDRDITEDDLRKTQDEFLDEMLKIGVFPKPVMPGVFCVAKSTSRGECSRDSKDRMPDTGRCSPKCPSQVQERHRLDTIVSTSKKFAKSRECRSAMEQRYWAAQIKDQLKAWPELEELLRDVIDDWPELKRAIRGSE